MSLQQLACHGQNRWFAPKSPLQGRQNLPVWQIDGYYLPSGDGFVAIG
jgi:hypothetical protein